MKTPIPKNIRDMFNRFGRWKPTSLESLREACHRMLTACNDTLSDATDTTYIKRLPGRIYVSNNGITLDYYFALSAEGDTLRCLRLGKKNRIGERELTRVSLRPTVVIEKGFTADGPHSTAVKFSAITSREAADGILSVAREYADGLRADLEAFGKKPARKMAHGRNPQKKVR